ncbi:MAG: T9SS type A sorting domain-containing protein, partial [Bacteroidales bacterium]|nr:T9SS type A sorting domain-containing protein [Bacteroidales bacterium]
IYTTEEHVGIAQAEQAEVAIYPNPASDKVFVQLDGVDADEICVLDIYGKQVKRMAAAEGKQAIDLQGFAKGMYFVQVRKDGAAFATRKLIKR